MVSEELRRPAAVGLKTTLMVHDVSGARDPVRQVFVAEKSPEMPMPVMESAAVPEFTTVITCV
jgi:hypothetical protein